MRALLAGLVLLCGLAATPAQATETLALEGELIQGGLAYGQTVPGARVTLGERAVRVDPEGRFLLGFGRDAPKTMRLTVALPGGGTVERDLAIAQREYRIQRIDGLPPSKVTPPEEVLARIRKEGAEVRAVRKNDLDARHFDSGFVWPAIGPISGVFGSQRILNGQPRQPHYGVDVALPTGSPVVAPADGLVTYANPDMYFSGGTLMIDHGHGLMSAFLHLNSIEVALGQQVRQGELIATIGATGRVTGAHLDWRVNWFDERLDAELLVPPMPETKVE